MNPRRRTQWAWALNGWANHGYATSVLVVLFPLFFDNYWAKSLPGTQSTAYLGWTNSAAGAVVMLLAPWLGALADRRGCKKPFLAAFSLLGIAGTLGLATVGEGGWPLALLLFGISSVGFFGSYSFFDALLVQVATSEESDRVSAFGYAVGYLGGGLIFLFDVLLVLHPQAFGLADKVAATRAAFVSVALWWALFALPLFRYVPEAPPTPEAAGLRELWDTVRHIAADAPVRNFLLGYWIYIDGLGTLQQMAVDFGKKMGFSTDALIQALLLVQFVSFPAALGFGRLAGAIGARRSIYLGLAVLTGVAGWSYFMRTESQFYAMAAVVGLVQGGVQSLSRSFFARIIPPAKAGEYFGFYNFVGKFAAVLGPAMVGAVAVLSGNQRLSIVPLGVSFVVGGWLLSRVRLAGGGEAGPADGAAVEPAAGR
ncbi:MAG: MFS transporter [Nevskia sp.]|nr:MFS transporter [Nevskia sp.]